MSDHIEHACSRCVSLLHHADQCDRGRDAVKWNKELAATLRGLGDDVLALRAAAMAKIDELEEQAERLRQRAVELEKFHGSRAAARIEALEAELEAAYAELEVQTQAAAEAEARASQR